MAQMKKVFLLRGRRRLFFRKRSACLLPGYDHEKLIVLD
jgi:hypothetical protein